MKFGESYEILTKGGFVTRKVWEGVFIWLKPSAIVKSEWCRDPILKMIADANGGEVKTEAVLCKHNIYKNEVMTGWIPQQDDLAADDWHECKPEIVNGISGKLIVIDSVNKNDGYVGDLFDGADVIKKP